MKEAAYKGMVHPILEYGSSVWDPHPDKLQEELEKVQNRAARFVTRNYVYETGSLTGILGGLKWESLKKRRKDNRLILLYKGLKGKARIPTDDLIPKTRHGRNQHTLAFQIPSASKDVGEGLSIWRFTSELFRFRYCQGALMPCLTKHAINSRFIFSRFPDIII